MDEQDRSFLKDEYLKLQDQYEDYDRRSLTIKGWVSAGSAIAIVTGIDEDGRLASLQWAAIGTLALCFWFLEARWKQFQYALSGRIKELESYFRGEIDAPKPLQIYASWFANFRRSSNLPGLWTAARQDFVMLPYVVIFIFCVAGLVHSLEARQPRDSLPFSTADSV